MCKPGPFQCINCGWEEPDYSGFDRGCKRCKSLRSPRDITAYCRVEEYRDPGEDDFVKKPKKERE